MSLMVAAFLTGYLYKDARDVESLPYRPTAEAFLRNPDGSLAAKIVNMANKSFIKAPGGGVDPGESPEEGLLREIEEETGIRPKNLKLQEQVNWDWPDDWPVTSKQKDRYQKFRGEASHIYTGDVDTVGEATSTEGDAWAERPSVEAEKLLTFLKNSIDPKSSTYQGKGFDPYKKAQLRAVNALLGKEASETPYKQWLRDTGDATYYNAIADAEHRNRPGNRFIRALHAGSPGTTAYGPLQLNRQYLQDFIPGGRYASALEGKPKLQNYVQNLERQAQLFNLHGNTGGKSKGYDKRYDYINKGGTGTGIMGSTPEHQQQYKDAALAMMRHRVDKEFGGDWGKYLKTHRGASRTADPEYYKAYDASLKKQYADYIKRQQQRRLQLQQAAAKPTGAGQ
jgi:putative (di)nucleoside polyphosphate hydrolase